ncbi:MAG: hypothetical protein U1F36_19525 [Planctomycetota bacterium]
MLTLTQLWLPILVSSIAVFLVSSVLHMVVQWHKGDYKRLDKEDAVMDALRGFSIQPGEYMFPSCSSMKEFGSQEFMARLKRGPVGNLIVRPSTGVSMGKSLLQWFLFCVLVGVFVAYIMGLQTKAGAEGMLVFRVSSAIAILGHAFWSVHTSIWKSIAWSTTFRFLVDGVIYGLVTGALFAWLWPAA